MPKIGSKESRLVPHGRIGMREERGVEHRDALELHDRVAIINAMAHLVVHDVRRPDLPFGCSLTRLVADLARCVRRVRTYGSYASDPCRTCCGEPAILADQCSKAF